MSKKYLETYSNELNTQANAVARWGREVVINQLPPDISIDDVLEMASRFGYVTKIRINRIQKQAYVRFYERECVKNFIEEIDGTKMFNSRDETIFASIAKDYPRMIYGPLQTNTTVDAVKTTIKRKCGSYHNIDHLKNMSIVAREGKTFVRMDVDDVGFAKGIQEAVNRKDNTCENPASLQWDGPPCLYIPNIPTNVTKKEIIEALPREIQHSSYDLIRASRGLYIMFDTVEDMGWDAHNFKTFVIGDNVFDVKKT